MTSLVPKEQPVQASGRGKDPKKVEAGRKGAAARKAKQERLLAELRGAKASLAAPDPAPVAKQQEHIPGIPASAVAVPAEDLTGVPAKAVGTTADWTPYIAGGLGIVGALWFISRISAPIASQRQLSNAGSRSMAAAVPAAVNAMPPVTKLKAGPDPFYMQ